MHAALFRRHAAWSGDCRNAYHHESLYLRLFGISSLLCNRYPGVQPFKTSDRDLFFGRDADIGDLHDFLMLETLDLVLAFHHPSMRKDTGLAVA